MKRPDISDAYCSNCKTGVITDRRRTATLCEPCTDKYVRNPAPTDDPMTADDIFARIQANHAAVESLLVVDYDGIAHR